MKNKLCYITKTQNKLVRKWTVYLFKILMLKQKVMVMLFVNFPVIYTAQLCLSAQADVLSRCQTLLTPHFNTLNTSSTLHSY